MTPVFSAKCNHENYDTNRNNMKENPLLYVQLVVKNQ